MGLSFDLIDQMCGLAAASPGAREAAAALRAAYPGLQVTRVDAMDMRGEAPVRRLPSCDLFLVDSRGHCWKVTRDPHSATAVAVADKT
ncbi:MAG: hypothetical protein IPJ21_19675 [Sterolibacteriaceae bacterium]|jgi:hypothetical protein|nr:hypothetical protein [Sterolibacteriaceae bacterium]MBK9085954.1 hypothetical protein [Sterolibacteriaceae bacterium]